jgi:hypothetical protein
MILTNRRHRLLFLSLAGMDVAVALPYLAALTALWGRSGDVAAASGVALLTGQPWLAFAICWAIMAVYMLVADLLNRSALGSPLRELLVLLLLIGGWLVSARLLLHTNAPFTDLQWTRASAGAVFNFNQGLRGELLLLLANFFMWWRVAGYTDRDVTFFSVGVSFRLGMLLALLGNGLLAHWMNQPQGAAIQYLVIFFACGLAAAALARIDQKAVGSAHSSGSLLPWPRVLQLGTTILVVLGLSLGIASLYTPANLRAGLQLLGPVGRVLQWVLVQIAFLFFFIFTPLLEALVRYLSRLVGEPQPPPEQLPEPAPMFQTLNEMVSEYAAARYCLVAGVLAVALILLFVFFARTRLRQRGDEAEEQASEEIGFHPGGLGLDRLRSWLKLLGRYGVSQELLEAISVENIYANLVRLARRRGYPRPPSEAPDRFLATLQRAFPSHDDRLARITNAYLRIHYGEQPMAPGELEQLRADYAEIIAPPADAEQRAPIRP